MKSSLNLMTDEDRRQQIVGDARRKWGHVLATCLAILLLAGAVEWWQGRSTSAQLRNLEDRYAPVQALKHECIRMRTKINAMREAQQLTLRLVDTRPTITLLGAISTAAAETQGQVYVQELQLDYVDNTGHQRKAVVFGVGQDNAAIASFSDALRKSELFADVTLSSSDSSRGGEDSARSFRIECQL